LLLACEHMGVLSMKNCFFFHLVFDFRQISRDREQVLPTK
jgi:hypothetical protein